MESLAACVPGLAEECRRRSVIAAAVVVSAATVCAPVNAQCQYQVTATQGQVPCGCWLCFPSSFHPHCISSAGTWCGERDECDPRSYGRIPLVWHPSTGVSELPLPPGIDTGVALGINAAGDVVGWFEASQQPQTACVWQGGVFSVLPLGPRGVTSRANAINDDGIVVGWRIAGGGGGAPCIWSGGAVTDINTAPFSSGEAACISNSGYVTGWVGSYVQNGRGFRWVDGIVTHLQPLPGGLAAFSSAVNNLGWCVGGSRMPGGPPNPGWRSYPTLWVADQAIPLGLPNGYAAGTAYGISDEGVILGYVYGPTVPGIPYSRYIIWVDGSPFDPKTLIAGGSGLFSTAQWINASGQMVGRAGTEVWILTPTPALTGDLTGDCRVDGLDLALMLSAWGSDDTRCDLTDDGIVDGQDLGLLLGSWSVAP